MGLVTCRCLASARFPPSAEPSEPAAPGKLRTATVRPELRGVVEDCERLWAVAGFAERFAANLVRPPARRRPTAIWTSLRAHWSAATSVAGSAGEDSTTGRSPRSR